MLVKGATEVDELSENHSPFFQQMGYRPSLRETLPPLLPPRDKTISAARGDAPEGRAARATEPTSHQAAKEDPDLYQTEITKQPSRGPKLDRNTQEELVIESCDETDDDVSLLELCTPRSDALEDFEEDDDDDLETLILDDDEPMSLSPTPTPTPTPMVPLPSPSSLTKPMSDTDLEGKRKMFLPKLLRNLKPCWMKKKQKIQPAPYPVQDEEIDNKKIAGNTMAEKWAMLLYMRSVVPETGVRARTSSYIQQILWDVFSCPCPWYMFWYNTLHISHEMHNLIHFSVCFIYTSPHLIYLVYLPTHICYTDTGVAPGSVK